MVHILMNDYITGDGTNYMDVHKAKEMQHIARKTSAAAAYQRFSWSQAFEIAENAELLQ